MRKFVFISNMAAPYQVKFCYELQKYFNTEFWFYEYIGKGRPEWWKIPLGSRCKILKYAIFSYRQKYFCLSIISELKRMNPDIIMLGNWFIPGNLLAYFWAKLHKKKTILFTEHQRRKDGAAKKLARLWDQRHLGFCYGAFSSISDNRPVGFAISLVLADCLRPKSLGRSGCW